MTFSCYICNFQTSIISVMFQHLRKQHMLIECPRLLLRCCLGCPATFRTYNGLRKHLRTCNNIIRKQLTEGNDVYESENISNDLHVIVDEPIEGLDEDEIYNEGLITRGNISNYVMTLYSLGLPDTVIDKIVATTCEIVEPVLDNLVCSSTLENRQNISDQFKYPFRKILNKYGREKIFQQAKIVEPVRKAHGTRTDKKFDSQTGSYQQNIVTSTFTYVPLLDTLSFLLNEKNYYSLFTSEESKNDVYLNFRDGSVFKNSVFFQQNQNAVQIQLYYDEFEVCNPLGSKTGIHKIGAFYFCINNLPAYLNSNLNNIHLLALCYNLDVKQHGIYPVLKVIVEDIKILEKTGVFIKTLNNYLKGTLVSLAFDNLAGAVLFGMNESFNSINYCRICTMTSAEAKKASTENQSLLRTSESFSALVNQHKYVKTNLNTLNFQGVKNESPLFDLKYFNPCDNPTVDILHDFLEGICQRSAKLFFLFCTSNDIFTLEKLNNNVKAFDFGLYNRPNFPSIITVSKTSNSIGQRGAQTHCLLNFLPLIIKDDIKKLNENYGKWKVILLLINIMKIVFAPKITFTMLEQLKVLIKDHHELLIKEYEVNLTPKDHLITHYVEIIKKMGPPVNYWTIRYESKNGWFKQLEQKLKNYKDVAFTLSNRHQKYMLSVWENNFIESETEPILYNFRAQGLMTIHHHQIIVDTLKLEPKSIIYVGQKVNYKGENLILNKFICTSNINGLPTFGKVISFFSVGRDIFVVHEKFKTEGISESCLGYIITPSQIVSVEKVSNLPHTKSWNIYKSLEDKNVIITEYFL